MEDRESAIRLAQWEGRSNRNVILRKNSPGATEDARRRTILRLAVSSTCEAHGSLRMTFLTRTYLPNFSKNKQIDSIPR
jgi:hypothetical protein